ncbi:Epidermal patterning factor-like protein [Heracleum sosnowskyi]|uniref:Epidermal patterning factor-like protein n=1 Tax=Heracleum sosnowskyi TaxID=360622 RepID=A0AAD8GNC3_9APIA|nr:Epidermal patterning factor-like protein [Heracleum sosnowskyi]
MGCNQNLMIHARHKLIRFTVSLLFLLVSTSTHHSYTAAGRILGDPLASSQDAKSILSGQIGSRPPRCERRCGSCGHCEAIQVPTNPQIKGGNKNSTTVFKIAYSRGEDNSNYKPMSWKCKCGNFIFNP